MNEVVYTGEPFPASRADEARLRQHLGGWVRREGPLLRIDKVVGQVRMDRDRTLVIRSRKADGASLLAWLAHADPQLAALRMLGTTPRSAEDGGFGSLIARVFCLETWRAIQTTGLLRSYHRRQIRAATIRGRIDFSQLSRGGGNLGRIPCVVFARLPQTPLNRLLAAATQRIEHDTELRRAAGASLAMLSTALAEVPPLVTTAELARPPSLSRLEQPFAASAALAGLLLCGNGLDDGRQVGGPALVVVISRLFECTVVRAFRDARLRLSTQHPVEVRYAGPHSTTGRSPMRIDLLLHDLPGGPVIVDAKYKTKITSSDLQQMVTYCWATGARRAVLVVPAGSVQDTRTIVLENAFDEQIEVAVAELQLGARHLGGWQRAGQQLVEQVVQRSR